MMKNVNFVENKPEIMQHVLEMKYISWLHKYTRRILGVFFYIHSLVNAGHWKGTLQIFLMDTDCSLHQVRA
jgi:hypothetical protein